MFYLTTHSTHFIYGSILKRKEMFYLTKYSTHFYRYMVSDMVKDNSHSQKEGSVLFDDTLNTFYLRLYGVSERGNPLLPHGLLFLISSKGSFICIIPHTG